jgi:hypothetical protein
VNYLYGDAGQSLLDTAKGGSDALIGGAGGYNQLSGDAYSLFDSATGGSDTLTGGIGSLTNTLRGDAYEMSGFSKGGSDILTGGAGSEYNYLYGDAEFMHDQATGGRDTLIGGADSINTLFGDAYRMDGDVRGGNDRLVGASRSTDHMWGDAAEMAPTAMGGRDVFAFRPLNGSDFIYDFRQGEDQIELGGFFKDTLSKKGASKALLSFGDLNIETVDTNDDTIADSSVIRLDQVNSITVYGITGLVASDFLFVA